MIAIFCIDDRKGMMFNHRRQSRDSIVCDDILKGCKGRKLYMSAYSKAIFQEDSEVDILIAEDGSCLDTAEAEDFYFIEDAKMIGDESKIKKLILYHWNRRYPADTYFPLELSEEKWELAERTEFRGSSHEKITKEIYNRRENG